MLGALLPLAFLVLFDQIWADQSLQDKEDELGDIFGRKLKMFGGNPASNDGKREKRQMTVCFNCFPPTDGNGTFCGTTGKQTFAYATDKDGCPQITVTCSGYGNVFILVKTSWDPEAVVNYALGDLTDYNVVTATLSCGEYGWGATDSSLEIIDNAFTCQVDSPTAPSQETAPTCSCSPLHSYKRK